MHKLLILFPPFASHNYKMFKFCGHYNYVVGDTVFSIIFTKCVLKTCIILLAVISLATPMQQTFNSAYFLDYSGLISVQTKAGSYGKSNTVNTCI